MKIRAYSPQTGNLISEDITGINFGNIRQGEHCVSPILIQPLKTDEELFDGILLYLQNNGGYTQSQFGYFVSSDLFTGVNSDDPGATGTIISDHFSLVSDATGAGGVSSQSCDYIWLDVQVGLTESGSTSNINYRFVFEYN
jgi:hypothetical protein